MTTITTRAGKGSPLTNAEVDANFTGLNTDKEDKTNKGVANGYAGLDATGKVPAAQLPSYVDDVLEFASLAGFPGTGETGKIYVALDTNKTYRWSGSAYIYITSGAVDSVAGKTGVVSLVKADVGLGNVDNTSDANKPVSAYQQTALNLKLDKAGGTITANSDSAALTITQTGTGNALVVEDSGSPDTTPIVINSSGQMFVGSSAGVNLPDCYGTAKNPSFEVIAESYSGSSVGIVCNPGALAGSGSLTFAKSRGTNAAPTVVASNDYLGMVNFAGNDGAAFIRSASIASFVDGIPGANNMPGRLVFSTTASGSATPTESFRVDSKQNIGKGGSSAIQAEFEIRGNKVVTDGGTGYTGFSNAASITDATVTGARGFTTYINPGSNVTLGSLIHYDAGQRTFVGTATTQVGFSAAFSLVGATNNYGFKGDIPAGTGRWNFYASGSADNYFGGPTSINVANNTKAALTITQTGTGNALVVEDSTSPDSTPFVIDQNGFVIKGATQSYTIGGGTPAIQIHNTGTTIYAATRWTADATGPILGLGKSRSNVVGTFSAAQSGDTYGSITGYADDGTDIASTAAMIQFIADGNASLDSTPGLISLKTTPAGSNYPSERMRIDSIGQISFGDVPIAGVTLSNRKSITGATIGYGFALKSTVQPDVTVGVVGYSSHLSTYPTSFTLGTLTHYEAAQGIIGAGSVVTYQHGFRANSTLIGAANNYGFRGDIPSGTGRYNLYMGGTADNWFNGNVLIGGAGGLGYTTGSGGAVTQDTSRTTDVTLNKTNGAITLASAAGSTAWQSFTVTNSTVAATDVINVCQKSGTDLYMIHVTAVAAGSFRISFATTGGTTTEQPVFNFAVTKAVTA